MTEIRQPIVTVVGHVDHGKTSLLDALRGSSLQEKEAGGITQKISFTRFPLEQIHSTCPLLKKQGVELKIPGFLFIDTPGHAAFTNLRKRGGSLADLAVLVVDIKEGIKPQTAEVLSLLKTYKTPFVIALNKVDTISGWQARPSIKESIDTQTIHTREVFDTALLTFQGALQAHGFDSDLFYDITDFRKKVALVPCSARAGYGISELLFVLCGLCQRFLTERLTMKPEAKGVILEVKKERAMENVEAIIYDGEINEGDELAIATFGDPIVTKVRSIEEIDPLSIKYSPVKAAKAATGVRLRLADKDGVLAGMPFQEINNNLAELASQFKKDLGGSLGTDREGIIARADSLGSLEALLILLKQARISVVRAGIGPISKSDIVAAKANLDINPLDAIIVGFNVETEADIEPGAVKILTEPVVYRLIENLEAWRKIKQAEIEKEKLMGLATITKLEILPQYVFRNSNPAIFGVRIAAGKLKNGIPLIDNNGEDIARVKAIQSEKKSVEEAAQGLEVAISLPGTTFDRQLKESRFLYADLSERQFRDFKKHKDLLSAEELRVLQEVADVKRRTKDNWGI